MMNPVQLLRRPVLKRLVLAVAALALCAVLAVAPGCINPHLSYTVTVVGDGTVSADPAPGYPDNPTSKLVRSGQPFTGSRPTTLTATPAGDQPYIIWSGDVSATGPKVVLNPPDVAYSLDMTVTVTFTSDP